MQLTDKHNNIIIVLVSVCIIVVHQNTGTCKVEQNTTKRKEIDTICTIEFCGAYNILIGCLYRTWSIDQECGIKK